MVSFGDADQLRVKQSLPGANLPERLNVPKRDIVSNRSEHFFVSIDTNMSASVAREQ